jgi:hypothetical protein
VLRAKHRALLGRALDDDGVRAVLDWCEGLPTARSVRGLAAAVGSR